ncbi:Succinate dehydrogenase cytochrome b556 subunit [Hydrogenovibrio crunogenus]|uniref:Succinate dehydrogenase cytochrome b556 subunit n=1 Tax=Hydrogenovibrio crunogenus TaxID=39765 RepID=A0A4P7P2I3_9GAMM|nr:succinate dehydrogenase, cytochrome b556 subunit [Hydrogenovibrio crunogenus]QBZ84075.1 Succinate dehydrogenase cytochrome b556 subunit [Hydrogenovibrio crunogenus]RUM92044.1 MAG: succinate dehydrogenase, cytochrome b556 subunit [Thiomicrospira sp.]
MYPRHDNRPVYLNLFKFHFPLNAILSILHRITGVLLVLSLGIGLIWLHGMILQPDAYAENLQILTHPIGQLVLTLGGLSLWFHWLSGLRHLAMEHDLGGLLSQLERSRLSAQVLLLIFVIGSLWLLWEIWL